MIRNIQYVVFCCMLATVICMLKTCPHLYESHFGSMDDANTCLTAIQALDEDSTIEYNANTVDWGTHFYYECRSRLHKGQYFAWKFNTGKKFSGKEQFTVETKLTTRLLSAQHYQIGVINDNLMINVTMAKSEYPVQCKFPWKKNLQHAEQIAEAKKASMPNAECIFIQKNLERFFTVSEITHSQRICMIIDLPPGTYRFYQDTLATLILPHQWRLFSCYEFIWHPKLFGLCLHSNSMPCKFAGCKRCDDYYEGHFCGQHMTRPCEKKICGSNEICYNLNDGKNHECVCKRGYSGKKCDIIEKTPCNSSTCKNGGTCKEISKDDFHCYCLPNYTGKNCETDVNECDDKSACLNGGTCTNSVGSFKCTCAADFSGEVCQTANKKHLSYYYATQTVPNKGEMELELKSTLVPLKDFAGDPQMKDKHISAVCPSQSGPFGGAINVNQMCVATAMTTFDPNIRKGMIEHLSNECVKAYGVEHLYSWMPSNPLESAVKLISDEKVQLRQLHLESITLWNGLHFEILVLKSRFITTKVIAGVHKVFIANCTFAFDDTGAWNVKEENGKAGACSLPRSALNELQLVRLEWKHFCLTLNIHSPAFVTKSSLKLYLQDTHIVNCMPNYDETKDSGALCTYNPSVDCVDYSKENGCKECLNNKSGKFCTVDTTKPCNRFPCGSYGDCEATPDKKYICRCDKFSFGKFCELDGLKCDDSTCKNNGTCTTYKERRFMCKCPPGYEGSVCQDDVDECLLHSPCSATSECINTIGSYECKCAAGFTGEGCDENIDDCNPNKCQNGGTCVDLINDFRCMCPPAFTGPTCTLAFDACASNPCKNGGTCKKSGSSFVCHCTEGHSGVRCAGDEAVCEADTCRNGGNCSVIKNDVHCTCVPGFSGKLCETEILSCSEGICGKGQCIQHELYFTCNCTGTNYDGPRCNLRIDMCNPSPCANGGICKNYINGFKCLCLSGYTGPKCDYELNMCLFDNPCKNGGTCIWTLHATVCSCVSGITGEYCTDEIVKDGKRTTKSTAKFPIRLIYMIIPCTAAIIIIIIIIWASCSGKRKRRSRRRIRIISGDSMVSWRRSRRYREMSQSIRPHRGKSRQRQSASTLGSIVSEKRSNRNSNNNLNYISVNSQFENTKKNKKQRRGKSE